MTPESLRSLDDLRRLPFMTREDWMLSQIDDPPFGEVLAAFTDFGERRLDVWQQTLDPAKYEVRERGENWAVVREGSPGVRIWVLLRYEWHPPGTIRCRLLSQSGVANVRCAQS